MKFLKSNLILSTMMSATALFAMATHAADNPLQAAYKSTNVKSALIKIVKKIEEDISNGNITRRLK